jgi:hypothetical protein
MLGALCSLCNGNSLYATIGFERFDLRTWQRRPSELSEEPCCIPASSCLLTYRLSGFWTSWHCGSEVRWLASAEATSGGWPKVAGPFAALRTVQQLPWTPGMARVLVSQRVHPAGICVQFSPRQPPWPNSRHVARRLQGNMPLGLQSSAGFPFPSTSFAHICSWPCTTSTRSRHGAALHSSFPQNKNKPRRARCHCRPCSPLLPHAPLKTHSQSAATGLPSRAALLWRMIYASPCQ